jgi:hypothetical protein
MDDDYLQVYLDLDEDEDEDKMKAVELVIYRRSSLSRLINQLQVAHLSRMAE